MTGRHHVTYRALRLRKPGAGARLRERQHELKRVFRFRVRTGFGVVFRSAPKSLFIPLLVFSRPQVVDVVDSKRLVNHADARCTQSLRALPADDTQTYDTSLRVKMRGYLTIYTRTTV